MALFNIQMDRRQKTVAAIAQTWVKPSAAGRSRHYKLIKSFVAKLLDVLDFFCCIKLDFEKSFTNFAGTIQQISLNMNL